MSPSKPIVLFCGALDPDGVARNTVRLGNALAREGARVEVVTLRGGALARDLTGPRHTCLGQPGLPRGLSLALLVPRLRRKLRELDPALVVSMGNHAHLAVWAALRAFPDLPRVYRISNDPEHGGMADGLGWARRRGLRLVANDATRLICVSRRAAMAPEFRRARRDRRLHVIPNGVDVAAVRAKARMPCSHPWLKDGRPYVAALGRVHAQKNYETLIEALALARRAGRDELRLLIMGRAPAPLRRRLLRRAEALGVADALRLEGEVSNPYPLLAGASVYVLPSLWEGASNSLLEALACGVPTVAAFSAGNAPEVLGGGLYGVLADARNPQDLARAILRQSADATRVLPGNRVERFDSERAAAAARRVIAVALGEHDGTQMPPAAGAKPRSLGEVRPGGMRRTGHVSTGDDLRRGPRALHADRRPDEPAES